MTHMMMPLMLNPKADDAGDTCDADTMTTVNHHRHQSETPNLQLMKQCNGVPTCRAAIDALSPDQRRSLARKQPLNIQLPVHTSPDSDDEGDSDDEEADDDDDDDEDDEAGGDSDSDDATGGADDPATNRPAQQ